MSREIKFRIWDNGKNEWLAESDDEALTYYGFRLIGEVMTVQSPRKWTVDGVVEQYTGLKDKNGKEIYEGDIIHRGALSKANVFRNSVIRFDEKSVGFIATSTRNGARTLFNSHTCDEIEVIGNIHENPELLEEA